MATLLALNAGTTTLTAIAWDPERQVVTNSLRQRNDAALPAPPGRAEQDAGRLRRLAWNLLAQAAAGQRSVEGIVLTGQMHGLLCLDARGDPLTPLITWQDRRTAEPLPGGGSILDRIRARVADLDWRSNGCRLAHGYGAATLFWLGEQKALPSGTERVSSLPSWLVGQLAHQLPSTDPTLAASWGIYSLADGAWNVAFLERLGLRAELLPPVRATGAPVGTLHPTPARALELPPGLPVYNAAGDTQATFAGCVDEPEWEALVNGGTGGQVCWWAPHFELPSASVDTWPFPRGTLRVGATLCGGAAYAWLNATVRAWLHDFGVDQSEQEVYGRLNALAQSGDDATGITVRPTFLGSRADAGPTGGAIQNLTLEPLRLGALARATLQGMVDELRDLFAAHGPDQLMRLVATGGTVRQVPPLAELMEERFGMPVTVGAETHPAAVGAARLAAHAGPPPCASLDPRADRSA
jgi:sedoheptulokinase